MKHIIILAICITFAFANVHTRRNVMNDSPIVDDATVETEEAEAVVEENFECK
jgi:hypothetical protein